MVEVVAIALDSQIGHTPDQPVFQQIHFVFSKENAAFLVNEVSNHLEFFTRHFRFS
jgi:hypothetical protein